MATITKIMFICAIVAFTFPTPTFTRVITSRYQRRAKPPKIRRPRIHTPTLPAYKEDTCPCFVCHSQLYITTAAKLMTVFAGITAFHYMMGTITNMLTSTE